MIFDQQIEMTPEGHYKACNYNYPLALINFKNKDNNASNSRIVFTEIPCCHCPIASQCSATDPNAVVNP